MLNSYLSNAKRAISQRLPHLLHERHDYLQSVNHWGLDLAESLNEFSCRGKMIRGVLVLLGAGLYGKTQDEAVVDTAAAMELLQSFLLIHDDIMDEDMQRRGAPSVHARYVEQGVADGYQHAEHLGLSLGICAGDVSAFLAIDILSHLDCEDKSLRTLLSMVTREIISVGVAQMNDVSFGFHPAEVLPRDIREVYRYKTGRYTFSLPLSLGAVLAGADEAATARLNEIGEYMGIVFQIKDDEIGLYESGDDIGKAPGSDVRENKKTLYRAYLVEAASADERVRLSGIFGNRQLTQDDLSYVQSRIEAHGIRERLDSEMDALTDQARRLVESLDGVDVDIRAVLLELLAYNRARRR
jgi:geranylgeranyl diphosphate synthase, type I